jgi:hypothetical protein
VIFFDYDNKNLSDIVQELEKIQFVFNLSNFYIISTQNGYNAVCLDKLEFNELTEIYNTSNFVCGKFVLYCARRGRYTLGMSDVKKLILIVTSKNHSHEKSNAHKKFFNEVMNYDIKDNKNFDNNTSIIITAFGSWKHGVAINDGKKT